MLYPIGKNALQRLKLSSQEFVSNGLWQQLLHPSHSLELPRAIRLDHSLGSALGRTGEVPGGILLCCWCWEFLEGGSTRILSI